MMVCFVFFTLLLGELFLISSGEGVTFCVKPAESGSCLDRGCQKCETLQYYFDNVNKTINLYDNVTLNFMSGTHNVCLSGYFGFYAVPITIGFLKMTGENRNVTVIDVCFNYNVLKEYCQLAFLQINSTLFVENITYVNYYCFWYSDTSKQQNAANVILKGCFFVDSLIVFKKFIAEECKLLSFIVFTVHTEVTNCIIHNSVLSAVEILLESCNISESHFTIGSGSVTIVGNTYISSQNARYMLNFNLIILYSSATLSGNVTFMNNIGIYGGAMQLELSTLNITAGANVAFINNTAYHGGAIYLFHDSNINVAAEANLTFINNSALDKGGAIYVHPGVTAASIVANGQTSLLSGCIFSDDYSNFNNYSEIIHFSGNKAAKGGDDIYGASLLACSINSHSSGTSSAASDPLKVCLCESPSNHSAME